jgi:hypothetical protein
VSLDLASGLAVRRNADTSGWLVVETAFWKAGTIYTLESSSSFVDWTRPDGKT